MIILHSFHVRSRQCLSKLQSQTLTTELTPLRLSSSVLIRQKYHTTTFNIDKKLLIKHKSLINKFSYILFQDEKFFI